MKKCTNAAVLVVIFLLSSFLALSQTEYKTHQVKEGETLTSIAKQYRVTPYAILQQNTEIKNSDAIKPNTILVIPVGGLVQAPVNANKDLNPKGQKESIITEPIGFKKHKVKRRETKYGICKKYNITEEQLKRYNKELYAKELDKGMVLQIPQYPKVELPDERELDMETYIVQPKETRWSIAHKYGITVDSLTSLNPSLSKGNSYLAAGQELLLPRPKGDSLREQTVVIYESFTVPKAMGLFRISQNYGITVDSVMNLNPEIKEIGGLKEGMVLRLPKKNAASKTVNTDNYIFYEVKPKQNIFRLTQNLNISRDSLFALNPALENGLKAGMVLKLPKVKESNLEVKNALVLDKINLLDSINVENKPNLLFLLPFRIPDIQFANPKKAIAQVEKLGGVSYAAGIYTGAMVALDSIKNLGVSVDVAVLDTRRNLTHLQNTLNNVELQKIDAIIGPIDPNLLDEVAVRAAKFNIPVVAPIAARGKVSHENVFYTRPDQAVLRDKLLTYLKGKHTTENIVVIADWKHQEEKDSILAMFPTARPAKMAKDGSLHLIDFQAMLSEREENWVFVETDQANLISSVTSILNASIGNIEEGDNIKVKMFTTDYNRAFEEEEINKPHLSNLNFTFPSYFKAADSNGFVRAYQRKYGHEPDRLAVRGFDLTFDILLKLAYRKNLFKAEEIVGETNYNGSSFNYKNDRITGYYNRATYLLQYEDLRIKEIN